VIQGLLGGSIKAFQTSENNQEADFRNAAVLRDRLSKLLTNVYRGIEAVT